MIDLDAPQLQRVIDAIGPTGLLALLGFSDGRLSVYVPDKFRTTHPLHVLLGEARYLRLVAAAGGETVSLPGHSSSMARGWRLRIVLDGLRAGTPTGEIAAAAGVSSTRVRQIARALGAPEIGPQAAKQAQAHHDRSKQCEADDMPKDTHLDDGTAVYEPTPGLWRLAAAASRVGMSPEALAVACDCGDVPMTVLRIGPRGLRFIRANELEAFIHGDSKK